MIRTVSTSLLQRAPRRVAGTFRPASLVSSLSELVGPRQDERQPSDRLCHASAIPRIAVAFPGVSVVNPFVIQYRSFSSGSGGKDSATDSDVTASSSSMDSTISSTDTSVEDTLKKIFDEQQQQEQLLTSESASAGSSDAWYQTAETTTGAAVDWSPTWYNLADQAVNLVNHMHDLLGVEYGYAIVATTLCLRMGLFPLMVAAQRTTSRMAHLQPELNALKVQYEKLGTPTRQEQTSFAKNMKALFARYEVKPSRAIMAPLVQLPIFISMFFGLKKMPTIFPDTLSNGGMFWFTDLTVPDPTYILPLVSCCTFVALIEMGKEQMLMQQRGSQGAFLLNFFRLMAVLSLPVCMNFEASMLVYWVTNNSITVCQTGFLKQPAVRKYFGIWDPPKPVPGREDPMAMASVATLIKRVQGEPVTEAQRIKVHNDRVESKKQALRMKQAARERRARRGITGTLNR